MKADMAKCAKIIKVANIKLENVHKASRETR